MDFFGGPSGSFFWVSQVLLHCMQIYLKNLAKMRWKIETHILTFQTQKNYKKINVQSKVGFTKDITSNIPNSIYSKKTIIMDFFF
jgi:hypothetical protein